MPAPLTITPDGDRSLRISREFDAPRPLVWRAFTDPDLIPQWLWARESPMTTCDIDFRVGGELKWGWTMPSGEEMVMRGRFTEIVPTETWKQTEIFDDDWTGGETQVSYTFSDTDRGTRVDILIVYSSQEARDGAAATPMADGMEEGYRRLDGLLPGWT